MSPAPTPLQPSAPWVLRAPNPLCGAVELPGDKSISHRALLLHALAVGEGIVSGLNEGRDVAATRAALIALGCRVRATAAGAHIDGAGGRLHPAISAIDCANSGTTLRLLAGLLAAQPFTTTLDGDASLRRRPMDRIAIPLRALGARVDGPTGGRTAPLIVTGGPLRGDRFVLPVASAQVKSCLLLAAAAAEIEIVVEEPLSSRDHTERMLAAMGAAISADPSARTVHLTPGAALRPLRLRVPADPSSAALVAAAALGVPGSRLTLPRVALNPGRVGAFAVLQRMGGVIAVEPEGEEAGEPVGTVTVAGGAALRGVDVEASEIPTLVDEIPALAAVCAFARGESHLRGLGELRVKESDRVAALCALLGSFGIEAAPVGDDLTIRGGAPTPPHALPRSDDHRIVMAGVALALGALARAPAGAACLVEDAAVADVSFPGYRARVDALIGAHAQEWQP